MQTIAIAGIEGKNTLNNCRIFIPNNGQLLLGQGYNIMLSFLLPTGMIREGVRSAVLNLFETDASKESWECWNPKYEIYPILGKEPPYSECFCGYYIDTNRKSTFLKDGSCQVQIDITEVVNSWIDEGNEEGSLFIMDNRSPRLICYASTNYPVIEMRPSIRLICDNFYFTKPLSVERALVNIFKVPIS